MSDESKVLVVLIFCVCLTVTGVAWAISWHGVSTARSAFEGGYEQTSLPGQTGVYWVKRGQPTLAPELP